MAGMTNAHTLEDSIRDAERVAAALNEERVRADAPFPPISLHPLAASQVARLVSVTQDESGVTLIVEIDPANRITWRTNVLCEWMRAGAEVVLVLGSALPVTAR